MWCCSRAQVPAAADVVACQTLRGSFGFDARVVFGLVTTEVVIAAEVHAQCVEVRFGR